MDFDKPKVYGDTSITDGLGLFINYVILTNMKGGCFSTLSLHRSLHALHSVYGRRDRSGFSSMYRYVTISNHSTFSPYPSKYQTNRCHNLTCKDETSDKQKSKLKRKIFPQYPHESPTCPEEEPDQERRGLTQTDNRVSVIYIWLFFLAHVLLLF